MFGTFGGGIAPTCSVALEPDGGRKPVTLAAFRWSERILWASQLVGDLGACVGFCAEPALFTCKPL